jgi:hypothetical protein
MAANEGQTKQNAGKARPRRRPVTIDLPAEQVSASEEAGADAPAEGTQTGVPVSIAGAEPAKAEPPPPQSEATSAGTAPPPRPRSAAPDIGQPPPRASNAFALIAFAVIGALVVLLGGYLLMFTDILPPPGRDTADTALAETQRLEDEIAALQQQIAATPTTDLTPLADRVAALEQVTAGIGALQQQVDDLAAQAATDRTERQNIANDLAELTREVTTAAAAAGDPQAAEELGNEINALAERLTALENAGPPDQIVTLQQGLDQLQTQVAGLTDTTQALAANAEDRNRAADAARVLAYNNLRAVAERGDAFAPELAVLAELGVPDTALAGLESAAATGIISRTALADAFPDVADAILRATSEPDAEAGFWTRLWANAQNIVEVRPNVPIEGDTPVAIVSRMQAAIDAGDFATALNERTALPQAGLDASADWAASVQQRLDLDAAIADLATALPQQAD